MARQLTQAEISAFEKFAVENGLVVEGPEGEKNGRIIADFITNRMNADIITAENLAAAFKHVRNQLVLKSPEQVDYEELHAALSSQEQTTFKEFRYGRLKDTYPNAFRLLKFLRDRRMPVSEKNLQIAAGQLGQALEYSNPTTSREGGFGRHSGAKFNVKDEDGRTYVNGKKNHAADPHYAPPPTAAASNAQWQSKAEGVRGNRHSEDLALRRMFKMDSTGAIDWKATYEARDRAASGQSGSI